MQNEDLNEINNQASLSSTALKLIRDRKAWQDKAYKQSNAELHALLARCLHFYNAVANDADLYDALTTLLENQGFKVAVNTSLPLRIVRLIFAEPASLEKSKQRLFSYTRVLSIAKAQGIAPEKLPDFIERNGGIDEIRRTGSTSNNKKEAAKTHRERANRELSSSTAKPLFKLPSLPAQLHPAEGKRFSLALVRKNTDGTASIVFGTANISLVKSVLELAGKTLIEDVAKHAQEQAEAANAFRQDANLQRLEQKASQSFESNLTFDTHDEPVAEAVL